MVVHPSIKSVATLGSGNGSQRNWFGGVGASGYGAYHGERGFLAFTHEKAVFMQPRFAPTRLLYPPYRKRFDAVLKILKQLA